MSESPRIEPVAPPYEEAVAAQLESMMPPGVPPILLFRTFVKNLTMTQAMSEWGSYELSKEMSLSMREREIVIDRTCARCGSEYEWGVHISAFAERCGLTEDQVASLTHGSPDDPCWSVERERLAIAVVDSLHDTSDIDDELFAAVAEKFTEPEILDMVFLCGWYHAISFVASVARVDREPGAPVFADYLPSEPLSR